MHNTSDEYEEVEELDPLENESVEGKNTNSFSLIFKLPTVKQFISIYKDSKVPSALIDSNLLFMWGNPTYNSLMRESFTQGSNFIAEFQSQINDKKIESLYATLHSPLHGYTWQGTLEKVFRKYPSKISKVVILPLFENFETYSEPAAYGVLFQDITDENQKQLRNMFNGLLEASMLKDNDTGTHIQRVNQYSKRMAEELFKIGSHSEVDMDFIENIGFLSAMHDVGKIGTPDDILNKSGPLEKWEWDIMKEHTINGAYILSSYPHPMARKIALSHHEWWDGTGYPYGLSGGMIPLCGRIIALADVYDALRMKRSYKESLSHNYAVKRIMRDSGTHFEPKLINVFSSIHKDFEDIYNSTAEELSNAV